MRKNKHDESGECLERGLSTEQLFKELCEERGWLVEKTAFKQELKHIDFLITTPNRKKPIKIDVKAQKKVSRKDDNVQDELCWIEICGVRGSGWLSGGSDIIAFERNDSFILVKREELERYVHKYCDLETFVKKSSDALFKSYRRWNRPKEHLTIVPFLDIMRKCQYRKWKKP